MATTPGTSANGKAAVHPRPVQRPVVVGCDGTWLSRPAMQRAAVEALRRGTSLLVLHMIPTAREQAAAELESRERASTRVAVDVLELQATFPSLEVGLSMVPKVEMARVEPELGEAQLLVLGDAGSDGPRRFLLGDTGRRLVRGTRCPILVVPTAGTCTRQRPVLDTHADDVPASDSGQSEAAGAVLVGVGRGPAVVGLLRVSAAEAIWRRGHLCVLHAYPDHAYDADDGTDPPVDVERRVRHSISAADLDRSLNVSTVLTREPPTGTLLRLGRAADLLVIGSRGPLAMARLAIGSVSRGVLDQTTVPVLVVPHDVAQAVPRRSRRRT